MNEVISRKEHATLVLIDMQEHYVAARHPRVVAQVVSLLTIARARGWNVVVIKTVDSKDWEGSEPVSNLVAAVARELEHGIVYSTGFKVYQSGWHEIANQCKQNGFSTEYIIVCGVHAALCVLDTVRDYAERVPIARIDVVKEACDDPGVSQWASFERISQVRLVECAERYLTDAA